MKKLTRKIAKFVLVGPFVALFVLIIMPMIFVSVYGGMIALDLPNDD